MKKHLLAAAVAAAVAVPAMAQNVTLSGRASMEVGQWGASGATNGSADFSNRTRVADTASRITFAVNEDLGGGLRAGVYCETGVNIDNGSSTGQAGTNNPNTTTWCSREGHARIGNNLAEVRLGRQNVWWTQGAINNMGSAMLGSDTLTNMFNGGVGVYTVRGENMVMLHGNAGMGAFAGSSVYWGVMGNSGNQSAAAGAAFPTPNTTGEAAGAGADPRGKYQGFKLNYAQGQLLGMVDAQYSDNGTADRNAYKFGVGYRFMGASSPSLISVQAWNKDSTAIATNVKSKDSGYGLVAQYDVGGGTMLHAQYAKTNDAKVGSATTADSGASAYTVGATRALSKRTHMYASYHVIKNEAASTVGMGGGNYQSATPVAGQDTKAWGLGMIHNF